MRLGAEAKSGQVVEYGPEAESAAAPGGTEVLKVSEDLPKELFRIDVRLQR